MSSTPAVLPRPSARRRRPWLALRLRVRRHLDLALCLAAIAAALFAFVGDDRGSGLAGPSLEVAVAVRPLLAGDVIRASDVEWRSVPASAAAPSALRPDDPPPVGRAVVAAIEEGEAITHGRLAPDGLRGLAALVPEGDVAVAVAVDDRTPTLEAGQSVEVFALADGDGTAPATRLARAAVIAADEQRIMITVAGADAGRVTAAVGRDGVLLALAGVP